MSAHAVGTKKVYLVRVFQLNPRTNEEYLARLSHTEDLNVAVEFYNKKMDNGLAHRVEIVEETQVVLENDSDIHEESLMNFDTAFSSDIILHNVCCINNREDRPKQLQSSDDYLLDLKSVYIDSEGDAHGSIYTQEGKKLGNMSLRHFRSTMF